MNYMSSFSYLQWILYQYVFRSTHIYLVEKLTFNMDDAVIYIYAFLYHLW